MTPAQREIAQQLVDSGRFVWELGMRIEEPDGTASIVVWTTNNHVVDPRDGESRLEGVPDLGHYVTAAVIARMYLEAVGSNAVMMALHDSGYRRWGLGRTVDDDLGTAAGLALLAGWGPTAVPG